jgi:hypothetical protein
MGSTNAPPARSPAAPALPFLAVARTNHQGGCTRGCRKLLESHSCNLFIWLVADGWCWFVLREKYCWLVADVWFVLREKYCWLVADKPNEQGVVWRSFFSLSYLHKPVVCRCRSTNYWS